MIDDRIASAFTGSPPSADVDELIKEAEQALTAASNATDRARKVALDPALSNTEVTAARRSMDDAAFARDRLQAALPLLNERLKELRDAEENARRQIAYDEARAQRDSLAKELKDRYPDLVAQLADLAARLAANDAKLDAANTRARPTDAEYPRSAEEIAAARQQGPS